MFPQILREFSAHWSGLNAQLSPDQPLTVLENLPVSTLATLGAQLAAVEEEFGPRSVESKLVRAAAQSAKTPLRVMARDFNVWMRAFYPRWAEKGRLPAVVGQGDGVEKVRAMAHRTLCLWRHIAARPPVLVTGKSVADYEAAMAAWDAALDAIIGAELDEALALAEAEILREEIVAVATAYGHAVKGRLREGNPRRASLPELWHPGGRGEKGGAKAGRAPAEENGA